MKNLKKLVLKKEVVSILAGNEMGLVKGGTYVGGSGGGSGSTILVTCIPGNGPTFQNYWSGCMEACNANATNGPYNSYNEWGSKGGTYA